MYLRLDTLQNSTMPRRNITLAARNRGSRHKKSKNSLKERPQPPSGKGRPLSNKKLSTRKYKRNMDKAMESLKDYESHFPDMEDDTSLKGISRKMMTIVEEISEKGKMSDNQYLEMMNLSLKIYKKEEFDILQDYITERRTERRAERLDIYSHLQEALVYSFDVADRLM